MKYNNIRTWNIVQWKYYNILGKKNPLHLFLNKLKDKMYLLCLKWRILTGFTVQVLMASSYLLPPYIWLFFIPTCEFLILTFHHLPTWIDEHIAANKMVIWIWFDDNRIQDIGFLTMGSYPQTTCFVSGPTRPVLSSLALLLFLYTAGNSSC